MARIHIGTTQAGPMTPERVKGFTKVSQVMTKPANSSTKVAEPREDGEKRISLFDTVSLFE